METLPSEIFHMIIFDNLLEPTGENHPIFPTYLKRDFLNLRLVDRMWNALIVNDSRYWSRIDITTPGSLQWARVLLSRAAQATLSLSLRPSRIKAKGLEDYLYKWNCHLEAVDFILPLLPRCHQLSISLPPEYLSHALDTLGSGVSAPVLHTLIVANTKYQDPAEAYEVSCLRPFRAVSQPLFNSHLPSLRDVTLRDIGHVWSDALPFPIPLHRAKNLWLSFSPDRWGSPTSLSVAQLSSIIQHSLSLLSLAIYGVQELDVTRLCQSAHLQTVIISGPTRLNFLNFDLPQHTITTLSLEGVAVTGLHPGAVVRGLACLPALQKLTLNIDDLTFDEEQVSAPPVGLTLPNLKELRISKQRSFHLFVLGSLSFPRLTHLTLDNSDFSDWTPNPNWPLIESMNPITSLSALHINYNGCDTPRLSLLVSKMPNLYTLGCAVDALKLGIQWPLQEESPFGQGIMCRHLKEIVLPRNVKRSDGLEALILCRKEWASKGICAELVCTTPSHPKLS
ncbi:hypothetical protein SISNIDRAFT_487337 [Sistotremastrum niveocremeum HHB9708]|uniref:F-box domain-containing protein n=1 Tax=Sistotremastrum niveocremeum HHB9708 TaxID=1314777 RepID=A0A164SPK1_9AGAM|nr:hypothetical protein SISNIDRAFT_487337 [Sistotremastrum niveocremeum HHB9708]